MCERMEWVQVDAGLTDYDMPLPGGVMLRLTVGDDPSLKLPYLTLYYPETGFSEEQPIPREIADLLLTGAKHPSSRQ